MTHFAFFSNSTATPILCPSSTVPPSLLYLMFWAIHLELFFMAILTKCTKLQKNKQINKIKKIKIKNCDGMFLCEVDLQHPNFWKWNPTMYVFLGITEIIFRWIFQNSYYEAFSLESLRSSFNGFSKRAIMYGIPANNWKNFFRSFGKFSSHGLNIYASHKKCKAVVRRCFSK